MSEFKAYTHVERLNSDACAGLLDNDVVHVTAKVDGTNAVVWYDAENWCFRMGSRRREIDEVEDNAGFANWFISSSDEDSEAQCLANFLGNTSGRYRVYGEWIGSTRFIGHIKDYNKDAIGIFYIFDVWDDEELRYLTDDEWRPMLAEYDLEPYCVPILATLSHPTYDEVAEVAANNKFLLDNANHAGEGVVCKVPGWRNKWGNHVYGKIVLDEFKQEKRKPKPKMEPGDAEPQIVEFFITSAEMAKTKEKICLAMDVEEFDNTNGKMIARYLNTLYHDCILEECTNWVKKFKNPTVNFAQLQVLTFEKGRKYIGL